MGKKMNTFYRLLLTFNATFLFVSLFFIQNSNYLECFNAINTLNKYVLFFILLIIPVITTMISLYLKKYLGCEIIEGKLENVELANNSFLPSYLGYFFVALSINNIDTFIIVYLLLCLFTYKSRSLYFNPIFLLFGYHFYYILIEEDSVQIFLISKQFIRNPKIVRLDKLRRINNFTYIDESDS